ncbi:MAG: hypothetical protein WCP20_14525 [Desulfuromonadales bacterium]
MTIRRDIVTSLTIVFLAIGSLVGIDHVGKSNRVTGRAGNIQAQEIVRKMVDDPRDAYRFWREAGYQGRTVVYIADRWESFDPGELIPAQMFRAYPLQLYNTARLLEDEHLNGVTLLYVASMNKIIRRIVAVMPGAEVDRLAAAARKTKDYRVSDRGVFVTRQGFPRWYMTGANFSGVNEPVLLYVGASYFKNSEPEELNRQLSAAGLQTDCVILCNERGKDTVSSKETARLARFAQLIGVTPASTAGGASMLRHP